MNDIKNEPELEIGVVEKSLLYRFCRGIRQKVQSPLNRYYAGEQFHHDPTEGECEIHFIGNGGMREYRKEFMQNNNLSIQ